MNELSTHGFDIVAELALQGMRRGARRDRLHIRRGTVDPGVPGTPVGRWSSIPGKRAEVAIIELEPSRHRVTIGDMARFEVDEPSREILAQYAPGLPTMLETTLLMSSPMALSIVHHGNVALHAGAVQVGRKGALLAASGTGGKTTLAAGFHIAGHRSLSDDLVGVDPVGWIEPAPALLRLRSDSAAHLAPRLTDTALRLEDGGKCFYEISPERRGDGARIPAGAIIFLAWSADETVTIDPVPASTAIQTLWPLTFYLSTSPGPAESFARLATLVDNVPAFVIRRPRDFAKLDECVRRIEVLLDRL
jgi:hypothetical protein